MHLEKHVVGDFEILAAATPSPNGGYTAAVAVKALCADGDEFFTQALSADGLVFKRSNEALRYHRCLRLG